MKADQNRLIDFLYECRQHKKRILSARFKMEGRLPLTEDSYARLSEDEIEHIDQFLFRFAKLQDSMGRKLFGVLLRLLGEEPESWPFIDLLNRLETMELLETDSWLELRRIRNDIAHEYGSNTAEVVDSLNALYEAEEVLIATFDRVDSYCRKRFSYV